MSKNIDLSKKVNKPEHKQKLLKNHYELHQKGMIKMLTEKQMKAAKDIACGNLTLNEVCEKNEVSRTSLWEWRQNPEFKQLMDDYAKQIQDMTRAEIKLHTNQYLQKLNKLTESKNEKIRLEALTKLLAMGGISGESTTRLELSMPEPPKSGKLTAEQIKARLAAKKDGDS